MLPLLEKHDSLNSMHFLLAKGTWTFKISSPGIKKCALLLEKGLPAVVLWPQSVTFTTLQEKLPRCSVELLRVMQPLPAPARPPRPLTRQVSFLTRWMTSPLLSTTSRLPPSLEFSEESSSTTRSGTVPVTRITSTWRRPATCSRDQSACGLTGVPWHQPDLGQTARHQIPGPLLRDSSGGGTLTPSAASPLHHLPEQLACLTRSQTRLSATPF